MLERLKSSLFFKNFSIYFIGLLLSGLISFITIPIITQKYTVAVYGEFSLIQNVILILISFGGGWLNQCVIRFNDNSVNFKINIYQIFFAVFIPLALISFITVFFFNNNFLIPLLGAATVLTGGLSALIIMFYQSNFKAGKTLILNLGRAIVFAASLLLFVFLKEKFNNILLLTFCLFLSFGASILPILGKDISSIKMSFLLLMRSFSKDYIVKLYLENKKYFDYGWPLAFWFGISSLLNVSDRYIIDLYMDSEKVGIYSSIYDMLSKSITLVCSSIVVAGFPMMTRKYNEGNKKDAYKLLKYLIIFEIGLMVVSVFGVYFLQDFFLTRILGIQNTPENKSLIIPIMIGIYMWQFAILAHKPLEFLNNTKMMLWAVIGAIIVNLVLNFIFIPKFGFIFAAYCTIFSVMVYLITVTVMGVILNKKIE